MHVVSVFMCFRHGKWNLSWFMYSLLVTKLYAKCDSGKNSVVKCCGKHEYLFFEELGVISFGQ